MILMIINCFLFGFRKFSPFWRKTLFLFFYYREISTLLIFFFSFLSVYIGMLMKLFLTFRENKSRLGVLKKKLALVFYEMEFVCFRPLYITYAISWSFKHFYFLFHFLFRKRRKTTTVNPNACFPEKPIFIKVQYHFTLELKSSPCLQASLH